MAKDLEVVLDVTICTALKHAHITRIQVIIVVQLIAHFSMLCTYSHYDVQSRWAVVDKLGRDAY